MYECPNCGKKALRERGGNLLRNIRLREKENIYDEFICGACEETFPEGEVIKDVPDYDRDETSAMDW